MTQADQTQQPARFAGLELLASSVLLVDPHDRVRYANPAAENMLDASLKSLSRQTLKSLLAVELQLLHVLAQLDQHLAAFQAAGDRVHVQGFAPRPV